MSITVNKRLVSPQDVTWFLDLYEREKLDLDPPYQRKSVWSINDRRYFLNTIFSGFPTPALFVHRTMEDGKAVYHIVDGKQRLETIIKFAGNEFPLGDDFNDERLDKKRFRDLDVDMKNTFWNYQLIVEQLTSAENNYIREIFDRVNRNTRKLTRQEIRHARFEGWFAARVDSEAEAEGNVWRQFGIVTPARARRMGDAQFIAEMIMLTIGKRITGFDQDIIDFYYSDYDDPTVSVPDFDIDDFESRFAQTKNYLTAMAVAQPAVAEIARTVSHFYSLWGLVTLEGARLPDFAELAKRYHSFMNQVSTLDMENLVAEGHSDSEGLAPTVRYFLNAQAAPTDFGPRTARHEALKRALLNDESAAPPSHGV
jgi:hypothetical protein